MEPIRPNADRPSAAEYTARAAKGAAAFTQSLVGQEQTPGLIFPALATTVRQSTGPARVMVGRRFHAFRHPRRSSLGLIHHAGIDALEPMIPPSQDFLEESDLGSGKCKVRIGVRPRTDEALARDL